MGEISIDTNGTTVQSGTIDSVRILVINIEKTYGKDISVYAGKPFNANVVIAR